MRPEHSKPKVKTETRECNTKTETEISKTVMRPRPRPRPVAYESKANRYAVIIDYIFEIINDEYSMMSTFSQMRIIDHI